MQAATQADFSWVQDLGIAGFPTLLAERDGQLALLTNGYQPLEQLQPLLAAPGLPAQALPAEPPSAAEALPGMLRPLAESIAEAERRALQQALAACNGNRRRTATELGISRASLYSKLQQHGLSAR